MLLKKKKLLPGQYRLTFGSLSLSEVKVFFVFTRRSVLDKFAVPKGAQEKRTENKVDRM